MNGTRVVDGRSAVDGAPLSAASEAIDGITGERVLASHPFTTARGDRGRVVILAAKQGLVLVQRMELPDGSVLEWTRAVRNTTQLVRFLHGMTLDGVGRARLIRLADEHLSRTVGA